MADPADVLKAMPDPRGVRLVELETQLRQRDVLIEQLQRRIDELERRLAELERAGKRQATPFARKKRKAKPKRPGRKAGQGKFTYRTPPAPETVNETKEAPLECCPQCHGMLTDVRAHEQFEVDIPEVRPRTTRYVTHSGYCGACRQRVRSRHPEQISTAVGAAGVVIGPRAKALAADLKHRLGIPYGKIEALFQDAFGLDVSRGGLCQADQRLAAQARPVYVELVQLMSACARVHVDETGWRIGILSAWLWVFTNEHLSVYTVDSHRSHDVVVRMLGKDFRGVLVSDCFTAYDHRELDDWLKQKCIGHLLKDLRQMDESKSGRAVCFARDVSSVLRDALALAEQKGTLSPNEYARQAAALETRLDVLIDPRRRLSDPDNVRFAKRLRKHREHLLRFLYVERLDATNNQAERQLRPAVITRKTGGCNRSATGAATHSILASILVTCRQQALPILEALIKIQQPTGNTPLSLAPPRLDTS